MSNINNQSKELYGIPGVQEISTESASTYSGGQNVVKEVTLYSENSVQGKSLGTNNAIADLSKYGFDNITSSISVQTGTWRFYTGKNFTGKFIEIEGETGLGFISLDNQISSLKAVG